MGFAEMDCKGARQVVFLILDNEMGEDLHIDFEQHVSVCPVCAQHFHTARKTVTLVRRRCRRARAPESLRQRILSSLRHL